LVTVKNNYTAKMGGAGRESLENKAIRVTEIFPIFSWK
jgi:hypothetical protein